MSEPPSSENNRPMWLIALVSTWVVLFAFLFFRLDLPNNPDINRAEFWLEIPDQLYYLIAQHPDAVKTSWSNFSQRIPIVAVGLWILAGAWGIGRLVQRILRIGPLVKLERFFFDMTLGLSSVSLLTLCCGLLAQKIPLAMSAAVLGTLLSVAFLVEIAVAITTSKRSANAGDDPAPTKNKGQQKQQISEVLLRGQIPYGVLCRTLLVVVFFAFFTSMMLGAMLPSVDFDAKEYHLQGPKEYLQNGYVSFLPHNVYTSFPFLTEMLTLLGMILHGDWFTGALVGKFVLMTFAPLTTLGVFVIARRCFGSNVAWTAALIHATTPWTYRISIIAYAEGGITCFLLATLAAVVIRADSRKDVLAADSGLELGSSKRTSLVGWNIACGCLAGSAMACKYPGVLSVVLPFGLAMLIWDFRISRAKFAQRFREFIVTGLWYSLGVLLAVGPWLLKNFFETGNPVYPLLHSVFGGIDWSPTLEANWKAAHGPPHHRLGDLLVKFHDVTVKSDWLSPLLFSLAPLAFFHKSNRKLIAWLAVFCGYLFLSWWVLTHRIDRFWIPLIPVVSILAGVGVWWSLQKPWKYIAGSFVGLSIVFNLAFISTPLCGLNSWLADLDEVKYAAQGTARGIRYLNTLRLQPKSKVLSVGEAEVFDADFPIVYNTVFDKAVFEQWCSRAVPGVTPADQKQKTPEEIHAKLKAEGITHVLVNWQEILRYRDTYGYTKFVSPKRFDVLVSAGVLAEPETLGMIDYAGLSKTLQQIVDDWPADMHRTDDENKLVISTQLYRVTEDIGR
jgi:4-amino-4-deoxy-L-arabinose transferase-like glycosyltransferase